MPDLEAKASKTWIYTILIISCALLYHGLYFDAGIKNFIDLGVMAVDSERILEGQIFGRDFIAPYGPGRYYLIAAFFCIFGSSMTVLLVLFLLLRVIVDLCTFMLAKRLLPWGPALLVLLCVSTAHGPTHKGFLTAWLVLLNLAALFALEKPKVSRYFLLGAATGLAGTFRYDLGIVGIVLGITLFFLLRKRSAGPLTERPGFKYYTAFFIGMFLLLLPAGILIIAGDPARLFMVELARANLLKHAQAPTNGLPAALLSWSNPAGTILSLLLIVSGPLVLVSMGFGRTRSNPVKEKTSSMLWIPLALSGTLLLTQYVIEPKINRLLQVSPPLFLCLVFLVRKLSIRWIPSPLKGVLPWVLLGLVGTYVVTESGKGSIDSFAVLKHRQVRVEGNRAGFSTSPRLAEEIRTVLAWAERINEKETFYTSSTLPLLYFLSGKKNPSPITDFTYMLSHADMQRWILELLREKNIRYYLHRPGTIQGFDPEKEAPLFHANLRAGFPRRMPLAGGFTVFMRR